MNGQAFTITVAGGSRAYARRGADAHQTLHRADCPVVKRAAKVEPEYLHGWIADGRVVGCYGDLTTADTPTMIGRRLVEQRGLTESYDRDEAAVLAYAREHAARAAAGNRAYRVCGRCQPQDAL